MNLFGSLIDFPPRVDARGSIVTTSDPDTIVEQAIRSLIETRQGERVMLPDYGIPDFVFSVMDSTFKTRLADALEQQIKRYVPYLQSVKVTPGIDEDGRAIVNVSFTRVDQFNSPRNLVFPIWQYQGQ